MDEHNDIFNYLDTMEINPDDDKRGYRTDMTLEMMCLSHVRNVTDCRNVSNQYYYCYQLSWVFCPSCWDNNIVDKVFTLENGDNDTKADNKYVENDQIGKMLPGGARIEYPYLCAICWTPLKNTRHYSNGCIGFICKECYPTIRQKFKFIENCYDYLRPPSTSVNLSYLYIKSGLPKKIPKELEGKISVNNAKKWEKQLKTISQVPYNFGSARQWLMLDENIECENICQISIVGTIVDCDINTNGRIGIIYRSHFDDDPDKTFLVIGMAHENISHIKYCTKNPIKITVTKYIRET